MASDFLTRMRTEKIEPNFWCSEEYFRHAGFEERTEGDLILVSGDGWLIFPPVPTHPGISLSEERSQHLAPIWSDFPGTTIPGRTPVRLDLEFIYDPKAFLNLSGRRWLTFRKNSRKWPREYSRHTYRELVEADKDEVIRVFVAWLETRGMEEEVQDGDVMYQFVVDGEHRKGLFRDGELVGFNVWDENWKRLNYRFCFCIPDPWLAEFMRLSFYTDPEILGKGKEVNDGGMLDNPQLEFFKRKLNPKRVRVVQSWLPSTEEE